MAVENLRAGALAMWAGGRAWLDGEERELSFAADIDQAAGLELLDVMRECGRRDREGLAGVAATHWATGLRNSLQEFKSLWISQRLQDRGALGAREARGLCRSDWDRFLLRRRHLTLAVGCNGNVSRIASRFIVSNPCANRRRTDGPPRS